MNLAIEEEHFLMSEYIFVLVWLVLCVAFATAVNSVHQINVLGKKELRHYWWYALIVILPLIYFAGVRDLSFGDSYVYSESYVALPNNLSELIPYLSDISKDKGFYFLSGIIKILFGSNTTVYFWVLAAIQGLIIAWLYRKYSTSYVTSIFLFIASSDYLSWMQNGIRQFTAVTIILAATTLMLRKKYIPLILVILIASTVHQSALLMLPIVFIAQGKAWNKKTIMALIAMLLAIAFVDQFTGILDTMLADTQYGNVVSDWQSWNDDGTNPLRVLVYSVPTILSLIGIRYIRNADDPVINLCCNMSVITTALYCLSIFTSGVFLGRLPIYTSLYSVGILLPWEVNNLFTEKSAKLVKVVMILAYIAFYYYQMHFTWALL